MKKTQKVPIPALCLDDPEQRVQAFVEKQSGEEAKIRMVAYSGKPIKDHWYWGDLVLNVHGMFKSSPVIPILEDHFTSRKVGFTKKIITENNEVEFDPNSSKLVSTEYAEEFVKLSQEGFPYQCSVYGRPTKVLRLGEGEEYNVNGFLFKGPGSVWDKWGLKEGSICTFGYDGKTSAAAFSKDQFEELDYDEEGGDAVVLVDLDKFATENEEGGENTMDMAKLKKDHPELYKEILRKGREEAQSAFSQEREGLTTQISELNTQLTNQGERIAEMEKQSALNQERTAASEADRIFTECFSNSDVPAIRKWSTSG